MEKTINLKQDYNYRGIIAEALAKLYLGIYGYDIPKKYFKFFRDNSNIDLIKTNGDEVTIYEVKSKNAESKNKSDITESVIKTFREARKIGIKTKVIYVYFHKNWTISFKEKEFIESNFHTNNGGYYKRQGYGRRK